MLHVNLTFVYYKGGVHPVYIISFTIPSAKHACQMYTIYFNNTINCSFQMSSSMDSLKWKRSCRWNYLNSVILLL
jgi:hypothetical protein